MSKNFSYIGIFIVIAVIFLTIVLEDDMQIPNVPAIKQEASDKTNTKQDIKYNNQRDVKILYENQKETQNTTSKKEDIKKPKNNVQDKAQEQKPDKKIYELIDTGATVNGYEINIASSEPIPSRNPSIFPQIPASIQGKIDGKNFSLVIPSDLGVKDFKIKIKNQETQEVSFVPLEEEHLRPGSSSVLTIDTNNFENIELRSDSIQNFPLPPMPPLPAIPSN